MQWTLYILEDIILIHIYIHIAGIFQLSDVHTQTLINRKLTTKVDNEHSHTKYLKTAIEKTNTYSSLPTQSLSCNRNEPTVI